MQHQIQANLEACPIPAFHCLGPINAPIVEDNFNWIFCYFQQESP